METAVKPVLIYGAGDVGQEYVWFIESANEKENSWNILGFLDDHVPIGTIVSSYPVLGGMEYFQTHGNKQAVFCAIGNPGDKRRLIRRIKGHSQILFPSLIHPTATVSSETIIGEGTIVGPGTVVSVDVQIGSHVLINQMVSISHHVWIENYAMVAPGCALGGHVHIGEDVFMGIGTRVIPEVSIGQGSIIGAGAVVVQDIPEFCTAVGIPAKPIKTN